MKRLRSEELDGDAHGPTATPGGMAMLASLPEDKGSGKPLQEALFDASAALIRSAPI